MAGPHDSWYAVVHDKSQPGRKTAIVAVPRTPGVNSPNAAINHLVFTKGYNNDDIWAVHGSIEGAAETADKMSKPYGEQKEPEPEDPYDEVNARTREDRHGAMLDKWPKLNSRVVGKPSITGPGFTPKRTSSTIAAAQAKRKQKGSGGYSVRPPMAGAGGFTERVAAPQDTIRTAVAKIKSNRLATKA